MSKRTPALLVFSDLDGTLLDHFSYSFEESLPAVKTLSRLGIPLILTSSKTRDEMLEIREALGNRDPFIVENGAAVYIPENYFPLEPPDTTRQGDYLVYEMAPPREQWLEELDRLRAELPGRFESFNDAGITGIEKMTGLSTSQAEAANRRGYSEPVKWLGTPEEEARFIRHLEDSGAKINRGGRFLTVSGDCDKGRALSWLRNLYQEMHPGQVIGDLAAGDSDNDRAMLEAAGTALLVRSPVHGPPALTREKGVLVSRQVGPAGWTEGISLWLQLFGIST